MILTLLLVLSSSLTLALSREVVASSSRDPFLINSGPNYRTTTRAPFFIDGNLFQDHHSKEKHDDRDDRSQSEYDEQPLPRKGKNLQLTQKIVCMVVDVVADPDTFDWLHPDVSERGRFGSVFQSGKLFNPRIG